MSSIIEELVTTLGIDVPGNTWENLRRFTESFDNIVTRATKLGMALAAAVSGAVYLGERINLTAASILNMSDASSIATDNIQALGKVYENMGGSFDAAGKTLESIQAHLSTVKPGQFWEPLLIALGGDKARYEFVKNDAMQTFLSISDFLSKRPTQAKAFQWGKEFGFDDDTIRVMRQGPEKLKTMMAEAMRSGDILSPEELENSRKFVESFKDISRAITSVSEKIAGSFAPELDNIDQKMRQWIQNNKDLIAQDIRAAVTGISNAIEDLWHGIGKLIDWIGQLIPGIKDWRTNSEELSKVIEYLALTVIGVKLMNAISGFISLFVAGAALGKGGLVLTGLAAIAAAVLVIAMNWDTVKEKMKEVDDFAAQRVRRKAISDMIKRGNWVSPKMWFDYEEKELERYEDILGKSGKGLSGKTKDRAATAMDIMMKAGLSKEAAAALAGVWFAESGLDPTKHESGGGPGRFLAQWTDPGRLKGLYAFAEAMGKPVTDFYTQVLYAIQEIQNNPQYAKLLGSGSLEEMTRFAVNRYEAPRADLRDREYWRALQAARQFQGGDINITQHIHGNDAHEIADRSSRKIDMSLQNFYPGTRTPVVG